MTLDDHDRGGADETFEVEVREPARPVRAVPITTTVELGRGAGDGIVVDDPSVSRRHVALRPGRGGVLVHDLGSSNGTTVDGRTITGEVLVEPGGTIGLGDTVLTVRRATLRQLQTITAGRPMAAVEGELIAEGVVIRFRPGSAGARAAPAMAKAATRAHRRLASLLGDDREVAAEPVTIHLVDHFPDPQDRRARVVAGTAVDAASGEIWMVATAESPPEDPHRALALALARNRRLSPEALLVLEGIALHLGGAADPAPELRAAGLDEVDLDDPDPALRPAIALSWARFLFEREGERGITALLGAAPERFDAAFEATYGRSAAALEQRWYRDLASGATSVASPRQFVRLSLRLLRPHRRRQTEVFVYMLASLGFGAAYPFVSRHLIDTALPSGEVGQVLGLLAVLGALFVVSAAASLRQSYQSAYVSGAVVRDLRRDLHDRLQDLPPTWFASRSQGDVLSRLFNDVSRVEAGLTEAISTGIFQTLSLIVSAVILLTLEWRLGLIVLLGAPAVAVIYRRMSAGARDRSLAVQEEHANLFGVAAENYQAQTVVKVFDLGDHERDRFARAAGRLFRSQLRMTLFSSLFGVSVNLFVTALRMAVIGLGAWMIFEGQLTIGGLVAFLGVVGEVLSPVSALVGLGQQFQVSTGALARIGEVLDLQPERPHEPSKATAPVLTQELRLQGVRFSYTPQQVALDGVDVTIPAGTKVAFVGPSGSGKSTILRLLMRLDAPDEGAVVVDGVDLATTSLASWRAQLGVVLQDSFLFDTTLRENIALGLPGTDDAGVLAAAAAAEIPEFVHRLPRGYDSLVGERGAALSGGQRQRVAIARALVRNPRILLLDEATSALDPRTERQIAATIDRVAEGRTVIAVTHRLTSVVTFDRIHVVDAGRITEVGTHDELLALDGVYARLWAEQQGGTPDEPGAGGGGADLVDALGRVTPFADLPPADLALLATAVEPVTLDAGDAYAERAELAVITRGRADVVVATAGRRRVVVTRIGAGDAFGVAGFLGAPGEAELVATEPVSLATLTSDAVRALAADQPSLAAALAPWLEGAHERADTPDAGAAIVLARETGLFRVVA